MKTNHLFAILAILAGLFAAFTSHSTRNHLYPTWTFEKARVEGVKVHYISPHHLADLLYQKEEVVLLDARSWQDYESYHLPTALHLEKGQKQNRDAGQGLTVLYGSGEDRELASQARELPGKVYVLKGGMRAWNDQVLFPDMLVYRVRNSDQLLDLLRRSQFFGGQALNTQVLNLNLRESRFREGC